MTNHSTAIQSEISEQARLKRAKAIALRDQQTRKADAARDMLAALLVMSCAANWAAHEAAMADVRAAIAKAKAAGIES